MSVLGDMLRETAAACIRAAHVADGDFSADIEDEDVEAMVAAWQASDWRDCRDGYRAELRALIARGWRRPRSR